MDLKSKLETIKVTSNFCVSTYITYDENKYILELDYMNGKFVSQKEFSNNYKGIAFMEETKELYKSDNDIKKYFGIV